MAKWKGHRLKLECVILLRVISIYWWQQPSLKMADVPNANTIFINNAHQFGLSDLHQMRGVGRSNKKAFCYFLSAPTSTLNDEARKRMRALSEHTALGSGFQIATRDLEIRGAGDLLW